MWGNNNNNMEKSREHLRHFRCARRADDAAGVCVWGEAPTTTAASLRWFNHLPHPHHRVHCSRAIHLVIAHPTCRGGASASVAHWGIARLSQQLLLLFCCCCCFSFKQNSPPCYAAKAQIFCDCIYREIKSKQVERSRRFCSWTYTHTYTWTDILYMHVWLCVYVYLHVLLACVCVCVWPSASWDRSKR